MTIKLLIKLRKQIFWSICLFSFLLNIPSIANAQTQDAPTVRVVILYDENCAEDCLVLLNNIFPQFENDYGQQLEVIKINVSVSQNQTVTTQLLSSYGLPMDTTPYPVLLVDQTAITELQNTREEIATLLNATLSAGGNSFPDPATSWLLQQKDILENTVEEQSSLIQTQLTILIVLGVILLILFFGLVNLSRLKKQANENLTRTQQVLNRVQQEQQKLINTLIGNTDNQPDYLGGLRRVQFEFEQTGKVSPKAIYLAQDLLKTMELDFQLKPVAPYAEQVPFDERRHRSYELHQEKDMVWVIDTGWEKSGELLKPALVQEDFEVL